MKTHILSKSLLILIICGTILSCKQKPEDPSIVRSTKYKKCLIEGYQKLGLFSSTNMIPAITIAVSIDNQVIWADGIGYSNQELKVKASPSHKFRIGQTTEIITALTAAKLIEDGRLMIDKPVAEYLPDMSKKTADFTIRQLGANSSGLRIESNLAGQGTNNTLDQQVLSFINDSLAYEPGTTSVFTELGFDLMGHIIEKTGKKNFNKVVKETILDTLKLTSTVPDVFFMITENRSNTYDYNFLSLLINAPQIDLRGKEASAGYLSSVLDLVKIGNTLLVPGFLKKETINLLKTPFKLNNGEKTQYSFGWIVSKDLENRVFYGQKGSIKGGCSAILIYPEDKLVIAIAGNIQSETWNLPIFEMAEIFLKQLHPEKKESAPKTK